MERRIGEKYNNYKERVKEEAKLLKQRLKGFIVPGTVSKPKPNWRSMMIPTVTPITKKERGLRRKKGKEARKKRRENKKHRRGK